MYIPFAHKPEQDTTPKCSSTINPKEVDDLYNLMSWIYSQTVCYWQAQSTTHTTLVLPPKVGMKSAIAAAPVCSQICPKAVPAWICTYWSGPSACKEHSSRSPMPTVCCSYCLANSSTKLNGLESIFNQPSRWSAKTGRPLGPLQAWCMDLAN